MFTSSPTTFVRFRRGKDLKETIRTSADILKKLMKVSELKILHPKFVRGLGYLGEWNEKYLSHKDPKVRSAFVWSIELFHPPKSVKWLEKALSDKDFDVLYSALSALKFGIRKNEVSQKSIRKIKKFAVNNWMETRGNILTREFGYKYPIREECLNILNKWEVISREEREELKHTDTVPDW